MGVILGLIVLFVDTEVAADYFRYLALAMCAWIFVVTVRIIYLYWEISGDFTGRRSLLPIHVMAIAISYLVLIVGAHARLVYNVGNKVVWYGLPVTLTADVIGIFALGVIWRYQVEKRKARHEVQV